MNISALEFVKLYCENSGMTESEFYETQVPMPDATSPHGWAAVSNSPLSIKAHVDLYTANQSDPDGEILDIQRPAYEIKQFGYFRAHPGEPSIQLEFEYFITECGSSPERRRGEMVPKYFLQGVINSLQKHCDEMSDDAIPTIWPAKGV